MSVHPPTHPHLITSHVSRQLPLLPGAISTTQRTADDIPSRENVGGAPRRLQRSQEEKGRRRRVRRKKGVAFPSPPRAASQPAGSGWPASSPLRSPSASAAPLFPLPTYSVETHVARRRPCPTASLLPGGRYRRTAKLNCRRGKEEGERGREERGQGVWSVGRFRGHSDGRKGKGIFITPCCHATVSFPSPRLGMEGGGRRRCVATGREPQLTPSLPINYLFTSDDHLSREAVILPSSLHTGSKPVRPRFEARLLLMLCRARSLLLWVVWPCRKAAYSMHTKQLTGRLAGTRQQS